MKTVVDPTADAAQVMLHIRQQDLPIGVSAGNLGGDTVPIEVLIGANYEPTGVELSAAAPKQSILDSGSYRLNKAATTNAVSLNYDGILSKSQVVVI